MAVDLKKLEAFYSSRKSLRETDGTSAVILDWLAEQQPPATGETSVDAIVEGISDCFDRLDEAKLRSSVIRALKLLADEIDCGEFKTGRHGNVSRMKWSVDPTSLRAAAKGELTELPEWEPSGEDVVELEVHTTADPSGRTGSTGAPGRSARVGGSGPSVGGGGGGPGRVGGGAQGRLRSGVVSDPAFPNLEICVEFFSSTKSWSEPALAAARAGLWDDDVPPPEWEERLDRLEDALDGVRGDASTPAGTATRPGGPGPRPTAFHRRS